VNIFIPIQQIILMMDSMKGFVNHADVIGLLFNVQSAVNLFVGIVTAIMMVNIIVGAASINFGRLRWLHVNFLRMFILLEIIFI